MKFYIERKIIVDPALETDRSGHGLHNKIFANNKMSLLQMTSVLMTISV